MPVGRANPRSANHALHPAQRSAVVERWAPHPSARSPDGARRQSRQLWDARTNTPRLPQKQVSYEQRSSHRPPEDPRALCARLTAAGLGWCADLRGNLRASAPIRAMPAPLNRASSLPPRDPKVPVTSASQMSKRNWPPRRSRAMPLQTLFGAMQLWWATRQALRADATMEEI